MKLKSLMSALPEEIELDYLVYSASGSLSEEIQLWDVDYYTVVKRMIMKMFDGWVEREYHKGS